jgi:diguanylate cyclase (GGDEF)-like protein
MSGSSDVSTPPAERPAVVPASPAPLAARALDDVRDVLLESWTSSASLERVVGDLARALQRTAFAPSRVSLAILPAYVAVDGLQWVWTAAAPDRVAVASKPHGFLDTDEHRRSALHEVLVTGRPLYRRLGVAPTGFAFLDDLGRAGATGYLAVLLQRRHASPSVISFVTERPGGWSDDDVRALARVTTVLSLLVEVAESERFLALAATDPLTGLANRRSFEQSLRQSLALCRRAQAPLSVLYFDVDHFKAYNDCYGHLAGDECLVRVATATAGALREADHLARIGGEEFAVCLPNCAADGATLIAERLRAAVEAQRIAHARATTAAHVTVSVGAVASRPSAVSDVSDLLRLADEALYAAKAHGRNRIACRTFDGA